jgi:hypothetical protein
MALFNFNGQSMFKITCLVAEQENIFYLSNVHQDEVEQVASVIANNLSFDNQNTTPTISLIEKVEQVETPSFEYIGIEKIKSDDTKSRRSLHEQGILTGAIHNLKEKTTTLYKFKVLQN